MHAPSHPRECNRTAFRYLCVGRTPKPTAYAFLLEPDHIMHIWRNCKKPIRRRRNQPKLSACGRFCASADWSWKCGRGVRMVVHMLYTQSTQSGNDHFLVYIRHVEKPAQPGKGGRVQAHAPPLSTIYISTITYKVVVYAPAERADTPPLFLLYPFMYSVVVQYLITDTG